MALLVLGSPVYAQGSPDFIKFKGDGEGKGLQIAVTDYVAPNTSTTVTLYGVVHVADADYYKSVQADLDKFDAVLYEGVKSGVNPNQETKILNTLQRFMGTALGLKFQKDSIDYSHKNLVHADVTMDELQKSMKGQSITPFGQYLDTDKLEALKPFLEMAEGLLSELMKQSPELQNQLKTQLGQQMANTDINAQLSPEMQKAIVQDRNQIVIDVLQEQLKKNPNRTFAVFYGAAHMPDLQERLAKLGFKEKS
jgi:hypothetical protein